VQAAVSAIETLHANLRSASRILSSNAVFVTLSAATVIIAASLVSELDVSLDVGDFYNNVVTKALQVLESHRWQVEGAPEAKEQLERFLKTVKEAMRRRDEGKLSAIPLHSIHRLVRLLTSFLASCSKPDTGRAIPS
jgi:hypothetical protein